MAENLVTTKRQRIFFFDRHPRLVLTGIIMAGFLLALIAAELTARVLRPEWKPGSDDRIGFWTYDKLLGWAHRPGQHGKFSHRDFCVDVAINSHGLRDDEYALARGNKKRMLVIGDSFAWGFGVEQRERFSEILESDHNDWEIINAAVSGYSTDQEFLYLRQSGMAYRPDVVLLLLFRNDLDENLSSESYWYYKPRFTLGTRGQLMLQNTPVPSSSIKQRVERFCWGRSYLMQPLYTQFFNHYDFFFHLKQNLITCLRSDKSQKAMPSNAPYTDGGFPLIRQLLRAMNELCKKNQARLIVVSAPMEPQVQAFFSKLASDETITYLALDPFFADVGPKAYFPHDLHWNLIGNQVAAKAIDGFLGDRKIWTCAVDC